MRFMRRRPVRPPAGSMPGTLLASADAEATHVSFIAYGPGEIVEQRGCGLDRAMAARGAGRVVWLDVSGLANIALIEEIGRAFGLHRLSLEDVVNVNQRPKAESFGDHAYFVLRMHEPGREDDTEQLSIFLGPDYVITFQERAGDCFQPIRRRLREALGQIRHRGPDYLAYALIDAIVDGFFPALEESGRILDDLETEILAAPQPGHMARLYRLRRQLLTIRRVIWPTRDMIGELLRGDIDQMRPETVPFLRDAHDHCVQVIDIVEGSREIAGGLVEVWLSSQNARMNEIMKTLTIVSTIFIPLSFMAGLWGMNFDRAQPLNMPELGWAWGYPAALASMATVAGVILLLIRRSGWLRDGSAPLRGYSTQTRARADRPAASTTAMERKPGPGTPDTTSRS